MSSYSLSTVSQIPLCNAIKQITFSPKPRGLSLIGNRCHRSILHEINIKPVIIIKGSKQHHSFLNI